MNTPASSTSVGQTLTMLRAVAEQLEGGHGLIAVDRAGRILLATEEACRLLDLSGEGEGHTLAELGADFRLLRVITACRDAEAAVEREIANAREVIVVRAFPVQNPQVAVVVLVRDETRLRRL